MPPYNWNSAIQYAKLVKIAEDVAPNADYAQADIDKIKASGYTFLTPLYANELATDVNPHIGEIVTFGFLAVSAAQELVAAIRGTDTLWEWLHDASFLMDKNPIQSSHGFTEDGFTAIYKSLRIANPSNSDSAVKAIQDALTNNSANRVAICGHSLGAALATLLTLDVALNTTYKTPVVYTYASPRVGDHFFAHSYNSNIDASFRIINTKDLVPKMPPPFPMPYKHVDTEMDLTPPDGKLKDNIACNHHLTSYLWLMDQLVGGANGFQIDTDCKM